MSDDYSLARRRAAPSTSLKLWVVLLCASIWVIASAAKPAGLATRVTPPGEMFDVGGRRMRLVCDGPATGGRPVVLFESGAFGFSGDWSYVQARLTAQGVRSCAYDRAGMGLSDPAREPRDGVNVARDLERLLVVAKVPGPYVLVGHSMAGARVQLFAARNPDKVAGLVLVDSTTPDAALDPQVRKYIADFTAEAHAAAVTSSLGILYLLQDTGLGDKVGLPPEQDREKRQQFASAAYNRTAYDEVRNWPLAAEQARRAGPLDPRWPVAVISAGLLPADEGAAMQALQPPPALASAQGYIALVAGATHNGLLGARYCGSIVGGIDFVLNAATRRSNAEGRRVALSGPARPVSLSR
jgi:pimeloyl-ACP methyl ester carboxylesterase